MSTICSYHNDETKFRCCTFCKPPIMAAHKNVPLTCTVSCSMIAALIYKIPYYTTKVHTCPKTRLIYLYKATRALRNAYVLSKITHMPYKILTCSSKSPTCPVTYPQALQKHPCGQKKTHELFKICPSIAKVVNRPTKPSTCPLNYHSCHTSNVPTGRLLPTPYRP